MLPATLQFLIAMIACAIDERMQRKLDYAQEVRVLKEVVRALSGTARISFTAEQRRRLAIAGKEVSPNERRKYCQIAKPATLLARTGECVDRGRAAGPGRERRSSGTARRSAQLLSPGEGPPGVDGIMGQDAIRSAAARVPGVVVFTDEHDLDLTLRPGSAAPRPPDDRVAKHSPSRSPTVVTRP